jgi:hypothetical protein
MSFRARPRFWSLAVGLPLACGTATDDLQDAEPPSRLVDDALESDVGRPPPFAFPGSGTSGAALPIEPGLGPETRGDCHPQPSATSPEPVAAQTVCFYTEDDPNVPAATVEQIVEVVGNSEWVHVRLILNPSFVDNSYGETAIGWAAEEDLAREEITAPEPEPEAPPRAMPGEPREMPGERAPRPRKGKGSHSFRDLVGSDHAEIQLLAADGGVTLHFKLDYLSESNTAPSGYASLGVGGGEGALIAGEPEWILGSSTSIDRNACGLGDFVEASPETNDAYDASQGAASWDYRVIYEVWVSMDAFGSAGFGSALIENVHASPSKTGENTETVTPAPCPPDPGAPEALPEPVPPVLIR